MAERPVLVDNRDIAVRTQALTMPIFKAANAAFDQEYPEARQFRQERNGVIRFASLDSIRAARIESFGKYPSVVTEDILRVMYTNSVPPEDFSNWRTQALPENGYADYLGPEFYLPDIFLQELARGGRQNIGNLSFRLAQHLIEGSIRALAYKVSPIDFEKKQVWDFFWGSMIRTEARDFLHGLKSMSKRNDAGRDLRKAWGDILYYFSLNGIAELDPTFTAVGAKVMMRIGKQPKTAPERVLGVDFDNAIVRSLAAPVMGRFVNLVSEYSDGEIQVDTKRLANQPGSSVDGISESVCQILGLVGKKKFTAYIRSEIPSRYLRTNNPAINPFKYPSLIT